MRQVIGGNGLDTTAAVKAWLQGGKNLFLATLYLIGEPDDPMALWLTDWESPLAWPVWGTFWPATIQRSTVTSAIGLEVATLDLTWSPPPDQPFRESISAANPFQLGRIGLYDNRSVRVWTVYMPTPGDANTFGASELFGGRVADVQISRGTLLFTVNSFLDVVNQSIPTNLIELTNTGAAYTGATPPLGFSRIPRFEVMDGSSPTQVIGRQTFPEEDSVLDTNLVRGGFLVFSQGGTLGGVFAAIQQNALVIIGDGNYNQFLLYGALPWTPTPFEDTFYVSAAAPVDRADGGEYSGFPFVPDPSLGI